jgi:hypothetical protein
MPKKSSSNRGVMIRHFDKKAEVILRACPIVRRNLEQIKKNLNDTEFSNYEQYKVLIHLKMLSEVIPKDLMLAQSAINDIDRGEYVACDCGGHKDVSICVCKSRIYKTSTLFDNLLAVYCDMETFIKQRPDTSRPSPELRYWLSRLVSYYQRKPIGLLASYYEQKEQVEDMENNLLKRTNAYCRNMFSAVLVNIFQFAIVNKRLNAEYEMDKDFMKEQMEIAARIKAGIKDTEARESIVQRDIQERREMIKTANFLQGSALNAQIAIIERREKCYKIIRATCQGCDVTDILTRRAELYAHYYTFMHAAAKRIPPATISKKEIHVILGVLRDKYNIHIKLADPEESMDRDILA